MEIFMVGSVKLFYFCKSDVLAVQGHRRSLILVPCDFLLVRHSNLHPVLHCFSDIVGFFLLMTPALNVSRCL